MLSPLMAAACTAQGETSVTAVTRVRAHGYSLPTRFKKASTVDSAYEKTGPRVPQKSRYLASWALDCLTIDGKRSGRGIDLLTALCRNTISNW